MFTLRPMKQPQQERLVVYLPEPLAQWVKEQADNASMGSSTWVRLQLTRMKQQKEKPREQHSR